MSVLDLYGKITLDTTEYDRGLEGAKAKALGIGGAIKNGLGFVAGTVTKGIGIASAAVGAFGASSVKAGMTFDTSMAQVAATMGKTTDQMLNETGTVELSWGTFTGNLRDYAQEMGANTVFSASQAADALNYMALAGYNTEKSMQTLPSVMNLASAGAMDLASASDMVTDTETALGLESQRTSHLIDEMAKTASTTNTSVAQLGSAILTIGGTAKQLKGGFVEMANGEKVAYDGTTELSAALGILADNGIKGGAAGTTLRNMISSMTGKKWAKTFGEMGVAVYDATGEMRSMKDILADMSKAMDGMTTEEKTNLINSTFNARDLKSINALLATTGDRWDEIITGLNGSGEAGVMYAGKLYSMKDAQEQFGDAIYDTEQGFKVLGAAEMMAFQQMDNLNGDITLFKSALEGAQIAVSDRLTPSLRDFVKIGSEGLSEFTRKFKSGDISGAVESVGTAIGKLAAEGAKKVPAMIKMGTKLLQGIGKGISQNLPELQKIAETMLNGFAEFLVNNAPALIQSGAQIVNNLLTGLAQQIPGIMSYGTTLITSLAESIVTALPELATGAGQIVESLYTGLMENIPRLAESAISIITSLGSGLAENIPLLAEKALPLIEGFTGMLRENAGLIIDAGLNLLLNLAQGIANAIPTLVEYIPQIVINIAGIINDNMPKILETGLQIIVTLGKGLINAIPVIVKNIPTIIKAIVSVWQAFNWVGLGKNVINFIGNGIKSLQANLPTMLKNIAEKGLNLFKSINWANLGTSVINFIGGGISSLIHLIPNLIVGIGTTAVNLFTSIDWLGLGSSVIGFIVSGIQNVVSHIPDALGIIAGLAMDTFKNVDWLGIGSTVIDTITDGLRSAVSGPLDFLRGLVDDILGFFDFKISFPSIELPHFSIDWEDVGWFSIPHVSIDWYAKAYDNPFLLKAATVFGNLGFGDRGNKNGGELVYSHDKLMDDIEEATSSPKIISALHGIEDAISNNAINLEPVIKAINTSKEQKFTLNFEDAGGTKEMGLDEIYGSMVMHLQEFHSTVNSIDLILSGKKSGRKQEAFAPVKNVDWLGVGSTVLDTITDGMRSAVAGPLDFLRGLVDDILGIFDFEINFPSIKLPHFSVSWDDDGWLPTPHIQVDWYAKAYDNPWLFTSPTVLGGKGFGDRPGGEIVYGHESLMRDIEEAVKNAGSQNRTFAPVINVYGNGKSDQELADEIMDMMRREYILQKGYI